MLIGQDKLKKNIEDYVANDVLPQFIMLTGQKGQGKRTLTFYLAHLLKCAVYTPKDLKVDDVREMIEDAQTLNKKRIYTLFDADLMTVQAQNALLKFVEEPPKNAIIVMTTEHEDNVLTTIKSRASVFHLSAYTREELEQVTDNQLLLQICDNIGQIKKLSEYDIEAMMKTAEKVVENIGQINTANAFNIMKHFDLEDADLFIRMMLHVYTNKLRTFGGRQIGKAWMLKQLKVIYKYMNQLKSKSINKQNALEMMFIELREVSGQ
jgi:DNA polymerase III delta prime subunit